MMSLAARPELRAFAAKDAAERRRLRGLLGDQLSRGLLRLLNEEIHTDLVLHVRQTKFKVHRGVLWARAPAFYRWVSGQDAGDAVTVPNLEPSEMLAFLRLIYSSLWTVKEREDHILQLIEDQSEHGRHPWPNGQCATHPSAANGNVPTSQEHRAQRGDMEENHNYGAIDPAEREVSCDLGRDLLSLLQQSYATDVTIQVEETLFHVHRAILCARSSYFTAMFSGCWAEASQEVIRIQGVKEACMTVLLQSIYGGILDLPKNMDPGQVLSVADMYALEGLREVALYTLRRDYCRFLMKPVAGMQQSVLECLYIAYSVQEEPLYTSCLRWIEKYFVKCWSERSFANLPLDLQESCLNALVQSLSYRNAAFLLMESDRLISSLPGVKWAERARSLASQLQEECVRFMVANFSQVIKSESFGLLLQAQGMSSRPYLLEHVFNEIEKNISFQNGSSLFMAVDDLLHLASENEMVFTCKIQAVRDKLWSFLVQSFYAVRHTEGWRLMRPSDQEQIRTGAKSKSTVRISNGTSAKRKTNDGGSPESRSSSTKKPPADGGNDPGLQKKKGNKLATCTTQRPKSAPAALTKKPGDSSAAPKSVSSKQTEVKQDTKVVTHSPSGDKHAPVNKKTTKTSTISATKTQTAVASNKSKTLVQNHKEPKAKVTSTSSKTTISNHKPSQKSAPARNNHIQPTQCTEKDPPKPDAPGGLASVVDEHKPQAASCRPGVGADRPEDAPLSAHECCQDASMSNQESMIQKPNIEHCHCQENNSAASVLPLRSNSEEDLTEVINETKTVNADSTGLGDALEQKSDCKNICDSENSKCADSSSESELCSVKEVERVPKQKESENTAFLEFSQTSNTHMQRHHNDTDSCLQSAGRQRAPNSTDHFVNGHISGYQRDIDIDEVGDSHENSDMHYIGQWNNHSSMLHERESPESESGSASTSSDDIKPRSEDYDAGGSQDDDGSNERGISKCSTMRCHDFLGRSSSDTSTPEELKGYDGSLRIDVKMKKDSTELFRVNSTSDDEGPRRRSEQWLQRDGPRHGTSHTAVCSNVQFSQEIEHLSSSADETEDERSEAENAVVQAPPPPDATGQPFQGIVNLAFDDMAEMDGENRGSGGKNFTRSVLLSVDECEELGSDEGDTHPSHAGKAALLTPPEVFEKNSTNGSSREEDGRQTGNTNRGTSSTVNQEMLEDDSVTGSENAESASCKGFYKASESELKSQARPCHLDLYTEMPPDAQRFCCTKTSNACKSQFLDYQGRDNHAPPTENSNTALSAGHIDDNDSMAQTCMYDHRPPKSLSPIYEMDPADGIEQRLKTEARLMDIDFEDQQFVERDWTLLRQLLADHGSDVDIINSVPEDLSLAQYLINQTLLLARENSKSQGKAWGDLSSPFEDSTSVTVTSFSPDECSSPHGEWTILELETHH
ncbi:BTB/POZ domain-containing protein 8 isoform X2 [Dendropsophus ebraccatus]|uniref:BTB/POZ domain-containing protein 8 isoform X2 n=1 Tax=Dendropsophus ebraccatus TaxID=150705 RepID=UPI00383175BD